MVRRGVGCWGWGGWGGWGAGEVWWLGRGAGDGWRLGRGAGDGWGAGDMREGLLDSAGPSQRVHERFRSS